MAHLVAVQPGVLSGPQMGTPHKPKTAGGRGGGLEGGSQRAMFLAHDHLSYLAYTVENAAMRCVTSDKHPVQEAGLLMPLSLQVLLCPSD